MMHETSCMHHTCMILQEYWCWHHGYCGMHNVLDSDVITVMAIEERAILERTEMRIVGWMCGTQHEKKNNRYTVEEYGGIEVIV